MDFPFHEQPNTAVIICSHILDKKEPILYVSHDEDDGMWQFLCGRSHSASDARIISLEEAFLLDSTIGVLAEMPQGCSAARRDPCDDWIIEQQATNGRMDSSSE